MVGGKGGWSMVDGSWSSSLLGEALRGFDDRQHVEALCFRDLEERSQRGRILRFAVMRTR